jgi:hypothetical protein
MLFSVPKLPAAALLAVADADALPDFDAAGSPEPDRPQATAPARATVALAKAATTE